jgi:hypothetical protein
MEQSSQFSFSRTGHDFTHDGAEDINGAIGHGGCCMGVRWITGSVAKEMIPGGAGAHFGGRQVGGVAFNVKDHVTGTESHYSIWVRRAIVKEMDNGFQGGWRPAGLMGCNGSDGCEHS